MAKQIWLHKKVEKKPNPRTDTAEWMRLHPKTKNPKKLLAFVVTPPDSPPT